MSNQQTLLDLEPKHRFFIGIDSDGCAFDTMEIKQKECFCPNFIKFYGFQPVSKYARETWEFVNLYSKYRGVNRFLAVIEAVRLLAERPEFKARNGEVPDLQPLIEWTQKETKLGNPVLEQYAAQVNNPMISNTLAWSKAVNAMIAEMIYGIPPFPMVRECLELVKERADLMVVSQTPVEALVREWSEHNLDGFVRLIAGQEYGTKSEHLKYAAKGKYPDANILMIGDAPGDFKAARSNGVLFFPIKPGHEEDSWMQLYNEGLDRFFSGTYSGDYQNRLIAEFDAQLPEHPHWKK